MTRRGIDDDEAFLVGVARKSGRAEVRLCSTSTIVQLNEVLSYASTIYDATLTATIIGGRVATLSGTYMYISMLDGLEPKPVTLVRDAAKALVTSVTKRAIL